MLYRNNPHMRYLKAEKLMQLGYNIRNTVRKKAILNRLYIRQCLEVSKKHHIL
jgi:hypothetical protein